MLYSYSDELNCVSRCTCLYGTHECGVWCIASIRKDVCLRQTSFFALSDFCAVWDRLIRLQKDDVALAGYAAEDQDFRFKSGDPAGRKVHDCYDLLVDETFRLVTLRDLCARLFYADFSPKIYHKLAFVVQN